MESEWNLFVTYKQAEIGNLYVRMRITSKVVVNASIAAISRFIAEHHDTMVALGGIKFEIVPGYIPLAHS